MRLSRQNQLSDLELASQPVQALHLQIGVTLFLQHWGRNTGPLTQARRALLLCHAHNVLIGPNSESRPQPLRLWIGTNAACCPPLLRVIEEGLLVQAQWQPLGEYPPHAVNSRAVQFVLQDTCR